MPAFVDWNSLLFGSPPKIEPSQQVASPPEPDASLPASSESWEALPESVIPQDVFPEPEEESPVPEIVVPEIVVPESAAPESMVLETIVPQSIASRLAISWGAISENPNDQFTIGAVLLGTVLLWLWVVRRRRRYATSQRLIDGDETLSAIRKDFAQRTEAFEKQLDQALKRQAEALEERFKQALSEQSEIIEEQARKSFNKRVETLEVRIKLDQEALNDVHRALSERMEAFEGFVQTIDAKQLDQEANSIAQRTLGQRLDTMEDSFRNVDSKARSSAQRIEAMDDSVRVIDTRAKALSQRVEAAEDNLNETQGQVMLLSHDVNRGSSVIEKLQRQVKMLPDSEKFKGLSRAWEAKLKKLEARLEQTETALEEHLTEPSSNLTWSHIGMYANLRGLFFLVALVQPIKLNMDFGLHERRVSPKSVEIEPSGPLYTRPEAQFFDDSTISPSSSSVRSLSTSGSHTRTYSTVSSSPVPMTPPERKRIDTAGFRETTFSSRQKLLSYRAESWSG
ncbi:hypothetical protein F4803DRAFT_556795 [Xylaria telfairii]|nr:hypothetical protein F4803DRAFT_556795 [Xylaria telfairii]